MQSVVQTRVSRQEREQELLQRAKVVWMTGDSGGVANAYLLERKLFSAGFLCRVIDAGGVSSSDLSCPVEYCLEQVRRIACDAKLLVDTGIIAICPFVSTTDETRRIAIDIIGDQDFVEVFAGDSPVFEAAGCISIKIDTISLSLEQSSQKMFDEICPLVSI